MLHACRVELAAVVGASFQRLIICCVTDVWDSAEDFQRFVDERLMPGTNQAGIAGEPQVTILPAHRIFAPAFEGARA